jgi:hypothetical protein
MKPDWKDAPEWAKWLAMDEDGEWFWFKSRPRLNKQGAVWIADDNDTVYAGMNDFHHRDSLEQRPENSHP